MGITRGRTQDHRLGAATFVLHSHLPYCRLSGRWPHGEEWFHQAMLECYLPLVRAFRRLAHEIPGSLGVTINITPILAEQMADPLMVRHFREYLTDWIARAMRDQARFSAESGNRGVTAKFHRERYDALQTLFEDELKGDILAALRDLQAAGHIEIASSAATHAYLPLLGDDDAVRFQIQTGIQSHLRHFGRRPESFWLPECAYTPGIERFLDEAGIRVFFVETHLVTGGTARGKAAGDALGPYPELQVPVAKPVDLGPRFGTTFKPYAVGASRVSAIARNEKTGKQVWSAEEGYPGDGAYREFHKREAENGLHYWAVTGSEVDLADKAEYDPAAAAAKVTTHAGHFVGVVRRELETYREGAGAPGLALQAYDTELFGHWWLEGVDWLEHAIRNLSKEPGIELIGAADYVRSHPPTEAIALPAGSWGNGGDDRTWMNPETAWTWPEVHTRQTRARRLLVSNTRATRQLARELLLLQASDWQFLMTTKQAREYAIERFRSHCDRFDAIAEAIERDPSAADALADSIGETDNPFPDIRPQAFAAGPVRA